MYTRMLLRAAILIGGTGACLALAGPAAADDTPQLGDGLLRTIVQDTVGGVVDVLTPPAKAAPDTDAAPQPKRPVKTAAKKTVTNTVKVVDTTVEAVATTITAITEPPPVTPTGSDPQPTSTPTLPLGGGSEPATDLAPAPTAPAVDIVEPASVHRPRSTCDTTQPVRGSGTTLRQTHTTAVRAAVHRHATPGLNPATPPPAPGPDHATDREQACPVTPTGNGDATPAPHPTQPPTSSIRVPGRDQTADGLTRRPDPPSG